MNMHLDIRQAHKRRIRHLRVQAALWGYNTPPEILMEIEDIQALLKSVRRIGQLDYTKAIRVKKKMAASMQFLYGCKFLRIHPKKNL
jgi:hypothetical protein